MSDDAPHRLLRIERCEGAHLVGLHRPEKRNAIDSAMVEALHAALDAAGAEPTVLVVHSTTPGMFAAGADLREVVRRDADAALRRLNIDLFDRLARFRWPTVAAVDGPALGAGCELALACDFRVCSPGATFGQPETGLGLLAGAGGNWRLPQLVGLGLARRMLLLGEVLDARTALTAGLVDLVADECLPAAVELARGVATRSWRALELTKLALATTEKTTMGFDIAAQALSFENADTRERITTLLDRDRDRTTAGDDRHA